MRSAVDVGLRALIAKTCIECGELKDACEYYTTKRDGYVHSFCKKCTSVTAKLATKKANDTSVDKATHNRKAWTLNELCTLETYLAQKMPVTLIAEKMGRTILSIRNAQNRFLRDNGASRKRPS